jgi:hypothetical protein
VHLDNENHLQDGILRLLTKTSLLNGIMLFYLINSKLEQTIFFCFFKLQFCVICELPVTRDMLSYVTPQSSTNMKT